jgi:putative CocE/NonD family hydrolase
MQGGPKPDFLRNKVSYYVMVADRWRYADSLEAITARTIALYLHSETNPTDVFKSGSLTSEPPVASEPDYFVYDPRDVSLAGMESCGDPESRVDQRITYAAVGRQLIYHSEIFEGDIEISGFVSCSLWVSIDRPDTDLCVSLYEVAVDGSAVLLTNDLMRARYRDSLRHEVLVRTQEPLRYDFSGFTFVSRQINKGNRLRLVVGPINSIYKQKNYNTGGVVSEESMEVAQPVRVALFHDPSLPSVLNIPVGVDF